MTAFDTLKTKYPVGSKLDTDGFPTSQPYQCYDVFIEYGRLLSGNSSWYFSATQTGYAKDIWNQYNSSSVLQSLFTAIPWNSQGQAGDVAVWGDCAAAPTSHVAILEQDNGTSQHIYGQNQPNPYISERDLTSTGLLGYLRPKTNQSQGGDDMVDQNTLNIIYQDLLGRAPDTGAISHYVGVRTTSFTIQDINSSAERAQYLQNQQNSLANLNRSVNTLTNQVNQLQQQVNTLTSQNATSTDTIKKLQDENTDLTNQLATTKENQPTPISSGTPVPIDSWFQKLKDFLRGFLGVK